MVERQNYQGVLNILSFNRHFYWIGGVMLLVLITLKLTVGMNDLLFWAAISATIYGLVMPLIISAYVYDFSGYYDFPWIDKLFNKEDKLNLVNIHAGFDETSFILKHKLPQANLRVYDFYNQKEHTEKAIIRAREVSIYYPNTQTITTSQIPENNENADAVFLLSAIHEIRNNTEKVVFLKECKRICKADGKVVIVEHLRNLPNFLAFTVGFTHFFSHKTWNNCFKKAGFSNIEKFNFTPFLKVYQLTP